jgi:hypothetical protein
MYFGYLGYNNAQKRRLASHQLQEDALDWWEAMIAEVPKEEIT